MFDISRWPLAGHPSVRRLLESQLALRLAHGSVWSLAGAMGSRAITLVITIVLVRSLGREQFGQISMIQSTVAVLGTAAGIGLAATATKYIAELRETDPSRVVSVLGLVTVLSLFCGASMGLFCLSAADLLATRLLERPELSPLLKLSALVVVFSTIDGVQSAVLAGLEAFRRAAQISIVTATFSLVVTVLAVSLDGLRGAIIAQVLSIGMAAALSTWASHVECRRRGLRRSFTLAALSELHLIWKYAIPALGGGLTYMGVFWIGSLILIRSPEGYFQLGTLRVVDQLRNLLIYVPTVLLGPTFAIMANSMQKPAIVTKVLEYSIIISGLVVFPIGLFITLLGDQLLASLYGPEFKSGVVALACAMIVAGIQATNLGLANVIAATGRMWFGFGLNLVWGLLFITASLVFVPNYGATGYLSALAFSYMALNLLSYGGFLYKTRLIPIWRVFGPLAVFIVAVVGTIMIKPFLSTTEAAVSAIASGLSMVGILMFFAQRRVFGSWRKDGSERVS
jgi:O-antigen/teichoic acid export membrane protein